MPTRLSCESQDDEDVFLAAESMVVCNAAIGNERNSPTSLYISPIPSPSHGQVFSLALRISLCPGPHHESFSLLKDVRQVEMVSHSVAQVSLRPLVLLPKSLEC